MKSLRIINVLAKIARVVCLILFILMIIGTLGCLMCTIFVPLLRNEVLYEGKTLEDIFVEKKLNFVTVETVCAIGTFVCAVNVFLTKYAEVFFARVVRQGTPFEMDTVKRMRKLAIVNIVVEIVTCIAVATTIAIVKVLNKDFIEFNNSSYYAGSISFGLYMLILSLFVEYGAIKDNPASAPAEEEKKEVEEQE